MRIFDCVADKDIVAQIVQHLSFVTKLLIKLINTFSVFKLHTDR